MSLPTLAATAAAVLLAVVGSAAPHDDGGRPGRASAHPMDDRPAHIAPAELAHFAPAQADEPHRKRHAGRGVRRPAFADFPKMKG